MTNNTKIIDLLIKSIEERNTTKFTFDVIYLNHKPYTSFSKKDWKIQELSDGEIIVLSPKYNN